MPRVLKSGAVEKAIIKKLYAILINQHYKKVFCVSCGKCFKLQNVCCFHSHDPLDVLAAGFDKRLPGDQKF